MKNCPYKSGREKRKGLTQIGQALAHIGQTLVFQAFWYFKTKGLSLRGDVVKFHKEETYNA